MDTKEHPLDKAIRLVGSAKALAAQISMPDAVVTGAHLYNWRNRDKRGVPAEFCIEIEKVTFGVVRCEDIRPDVGWAYLRSTTNSSPDLTPQ